MTSATGKTSKTAATFVPADVSPATVVGQAMIAVGFTKVPTLAQLGKDTRATWDKQAVNAFGAWLIKATNPRATTEQIALALGYTSKGSASALLAAGELLGRCGSSAGDAGLGADAVSVCRLSNSKDRIARFTDTTGAPLAALIGVYRVELAKVAKVTRDAKPPTGVSEDAPESTPRVDTGMVEVTVATNASRIAKAGLDLMRIDAAGAKITPEILTALGSVMAQVERVGGTYGVTLAEIWEAADALGVQMSEDTEAVVSV